MKAYCINLDRRPDRLDHMKVQFDRQGIVFERVPAVDGQLHEVAAEAAKCPPTADGPRMSAATYACFQSHREVWRRLVRSGDTHALVIEDDLVFAEGFAAYLSNDWIPPDADLIRLETVGRKMHLDSGKFLMAGSRQLRRLRSSHLGAGCYIIGCNAARTLLEETTIVSDAVDLVLFCDRYPMFRRLVTYQMIPAPAVQGSISLSGMGEALWAKTSITERFGTDASVPSRPAETQRQRIKRRLREEVRARFLRTLYTAVPHG